MQNTNTIKYLSIWHRLFKVPKLIRNEEFGGVILGYFTGSYPQYKIYTHLAIGNKTWQVVRDGLFLALRKRDRMFHYSFPAIRGIIKTFIYLFYVNYLKKRTEIRHFWSIEDFKKYKSLCSTAENEDGSFIDRKGRLWRVEYIESLEPQGKLVHSRKEIKISHTIDRKKRIDIIGSWHSHWVGTKHPGKPSRMDDWSMNNHFKRKNCSMMLLGILQPAGKKINYYLYKRRAKAL